MVACSNVTFVYVFNTRSLHLIGFQVHNKQENKLVPVWRLIHMETILDNRTAFYLTLLWNWPNGRQFRSKICWWSCTGTVNYLKKLSLNLKTCGLTVGIFKTKKVRPHRLKVRSLFRNHHLYRSIKQERIPLGCLCQQMSVPVGEGWVLTWTSEVSSDSHQMSGVGWGQGGPMSDVKGDPVH